MVMQTNAYPTVTGDGIDTADAGAIATDIPEVADIPLITQETLSTDLNAENGNRIAGLSAWPVGLGRAGRRPCRAGVGFGWVALLVLALLLSARLFLPERKLKPNNSHGSGSTKSFYLRHEKGGCRP